MKTKLYSLFLALVCASVMAQVPVPQGSGGSQNNNNRSGFYWSKIDNINYEIFKNGAKLNNVMDMVYLSTDSLTVLDKNNRDVLILADFKNAAVGATGNVSVLKSGVGKNFFVTNPYSFVHYVDDAPYISNPFVNINKSYLYYIEEKGKTYFLRDIRNFSNWGAGTSEELPYSNENIYWTKTPEGGYHFIIKGQPANYDALKTRKDNNDVIISENGVDKYKMTNFYNAGSYVYQPAVILSGNNSPVSNNTNRKTGCVSGDCQNGWGMYEYGTGYYEGFWANGKKNGYGLYKWDGIGKYIGSWVNDVMEGYGVYIAENEDNVIGEYKNGQLNGLGITVTNGKWDQGTFTNGNLATRYPFVSNNTQSGCTIGDCQNKYGRFIWDNGDSFTGFFKNGKMYMGTYAFSSGDKYSGMFNQNNQFDGMGRFFFANDAYYGGAWQNGQYQGKGYYHDKDLKQQIGEWSNGKLVKSLK